MTIRPLQRSAGFLSRHADIGVAVLLAFLFFLLQSRLLSLAALPETDEGVYAEAGKLIAGGLIPHRDFPFWHMPLLPALIGGWLRVVGNLHLLRLIFLALNCFSVLPLFSVFRKMSASRWAPIPAVILYLSFHEMVHHDFRFLAIRQLANVFFILFLYFRVVRPDARWSFGIQMGLAVLSALLFLPALINIAVLSFALDFSDRDRAMRKVYARRTACLLLIALVTVALYFLMIPHAFQQVILEQITRPGSRSVFRVVEIFRAQKDSFFYVLSISGLLGGIAFLRPLRPFSIAMLAVIAIALFSSSNYYPHYLSIAGPAFAFGILALVLLLREIGRDVTMPQSVPIAASALLIALHFGVVLPSLLREWNGNRHPDYITFIDRLRSLPGPLLSAQPIHAVLARKDLVSGLWDVALRSPLPSKHRSAAEWDSLYKQACTVLLEGRLEGALSKDIVDRWKKESVRVEKTAWGTLLLTDHSQCASAPLVQRP